MTLKGRSGRIRKIAIAGGIAAAALGTILWWCLPGLARLRAYGKLEEHEVLARSLAAVPEEATLPAPETPVARPLSIGYATLPIDAAGVKSIESEAGDPVLTVHTATAEFIFVSPHAPGTYEEFLADVSKDPYAVDPVKDRMMREMMEDPFEWEVRVARTKPRTRTEVFFMSGEAFGSYFLRAYQKADNVLSQFGTLVFRATHVRGVLHLGGPDRPGMMFASVFAKESKVQQGVYVRAETREEARRAFLDLMAGFRYTLRTLPDREALASIVHQAVDGHPKYAVRKSELEEE